MAGARGPTTSDLRPCAAQPTEEAIVGDTYKPGDTVPRDGTVRCTEQKGTTDHVQAGTTFSPCDNWADHRGKTCAWEYLD